MRETEAQKEKGTSQSLSFHSKWGWDRLVTRSFRQWDQCSYQETVSAPWTVGAYWSPLARSPPLLSSFGLTCITIPSWWLKLFPGICEGPPSLWLQYLQILCLKPDFLLPPPHGSCAGLFWSIYLCSLGAALHMPRRAAHYFTEGQYN